MIGRQFFVTLYSRLPVNSRPVLSLARPNCFNRLCKVSAGPSRPFASNQSELAELEGDIRKENLRLSYDFGHYSFAQSGIVESAGCEPSLRLFFGLEETKEIPNRELSMEEWTQFCDKKFVSERKFRTVFVTATLEYFRQKDLNLLGRSFVAFLINQKLFVSAVQVGAAIRFYAKFPQFFTEKDFLQLVAVLDKSSKPSVSFYLSQKLAALSFTSRLKECLSTLEQLKVN